MSARIRSIASAVDALAGPEAGSGVAVGVGAIRLSRDMPMTRLRGDATITSPSPLTIATNITYTPRLRKFLSQVGAPG